MGQQQDGIWDHDADNDTQAEFLRQLPPVGSRASGDGQQHQNDWQGKAVVETGFNVQQVTQPRRDFFPPYDRSCKKGVGRSEDGTDQE